MSKNKKKGRELSGTGGEGTRKEEDFSPTGVRLMGVGVLSLAAGFFVLSKADPLGQNWAATLSPFLILGGYALVGLGIFWREGDSAPSALPPQP